MAWLRRRGGPQSPERQQRKADRNRQGGQQERLVGAGAEAPGQAGLVDFATGRF